MALDKISIKRILKTFLIFVIPFIIFCVFIDRKGSEAHKTFFDNFDLTFGGLIIQKTDLNNHDQAKIIIKVTHSNKKEYTTKNQYISDYCILRNDTAYMNIDFSCCMQVGDSIQIGPGEKIIIKSSNDTILNPGLDINNCHGQKRQKSN